METTPTWVPVLVAVIAVLGPIVGALASFGGTVWVEHRRARDAESERWRLARFEAHRECFILHERVWKKVRQLIRKGSSLEGKTVDNVSFERLLDANSTVNLLGTPASAEAVRVWREHISTVIEAYKEGKSTEKLLRDGEARRTEYINLVKDEIGTAK